MHFGHIKCVLVIKSGHKKCTWVILGRGLVIRNGVLVIRNAPWVIHFAFGHTVLPFWDVKNCVPCVSGVPPVPGVSGVPAFQGGTWNTQKEAAPKMVSGQPRTNVWGVVIGSAFRRRS